MRVITGFTLLCSIAACGPANNTTPDAGVADPAYWGLADQECFMYQDSPRTTTHTVSVALDTTKFAGVTTYRILSEDNGNFNPETQWFQVKPTSLVILEDDIPPTAGAGSIDYVTYSPPPDYLAQNLMPGSPLHHTNTTATSNAGGVSTTAMMEFALSVQEVDPINAAGMMVQASKFIISEIPTSGTATMTTTTLWFAPNVGIVQIAPATGSNLVLTSIAKNVAPANCGQ